MSGGHGPALVALTSGYSAGMLGGIDLAMLTWAQGDVDMALPTDGPSVVIGRTFNHRQGTGSSITVSDGPQGRNWFQSAMPELQLNDGPDANDDADDLAVIFLGAGRFLEYRRVATGSTLFTGVNGASGMIKYVAGGGSNYDTYEVTDATGTVWVFWGGSASHTADWQLWKKTDPAGRTAYVGDKTTHATAVADYNADGTPKKIYQEYGSYANNLWRYFQYNERWQQVGMYLETSAGANTVAANATETFLYNTSGLDGRGGSSYIDKVIFRDRDTNADGGRDERRYYLQNWRSDVVALITTTGAWVERYRYDAYGRPESYSVADIAGSGGGGGGPNGLVTSTDSAAYSATGAVSWKNDLGSSGGSLVPDNVVNATDDLAAFNVYYAAGNNGGLGQISDSAIDNRKGLAGYEFDPILAGDGAIDGTGVPLYHVRNRVLNSYSGKWMQKDPLGYHDSMDLYEYCSSEPLNLADPAGLSACGSCAESSQSNLQLQSGLADASTNAISQAGWVRSATCEGACWAFTRLADAKCYTDYVRCLLASPHADSRAWCKQNLDSCLLINKRCYSYCVSICGGQYPGSESPPVTPETVLDCSRGLPGGPPSWLLPRPDRDYPNLPNSTAPGNYWLCRLSALQLAQLQRQQADEEWRRCRDANPMQPSQLNPAAPITSDAGMCNRDRREKLEQIEEELRRKLAECKKRYRVR